jgi:hypothetical protein
MNRIYRLIAHASSSAILLLALSACDDEGDYDLDPRAVAAEYDGEGDGETEGRDDAGVEECPSEPEPSGSDPEKPKGPKRPKKEKKEKPGMLPGEEPPEAEDECP